MSACETPYCGRPAEVLSIFTATTGPSTRVPPVNGSVGAGGGGGSGVGAGGGAGVGLGEGNGEGLGDGFADELVVLLLTAESLPEEQLARSRSGTAMTPIARVRRFTVPPGRAHPSAGAASGSITLGPR